MKNLKIFAKLFLSHNTVALLAIAALTFIVYFYISSVLIQRTLDQLTSINILKKDLVENYFQNAHQNLDELQLEKKFANLYSAIKSDPHATQTLQNISEIDSISRLYGFKNLYVFDKDTLLFNTGKNKFPEGIKIKIDSIISKRKNLLQVIDVSRWSPNKQTLLYYYIPIIQNEKQSGIALVEENMQKIQRILLENTALGNTGESYLVGNDFTMRSASRFFTKKAPASIAVHTQAATSALNGISGQGILEDYRHQKVLSVYRDVGVTGIHWAIISEMDWEEAMEPILKLRNYLLLVTLLILASTLIITFFISNAIAKPILQLKEIIIALSKGKNPTDRPVIATTDEIGMMSKAVEQLIEGMQRTTTFADEIGVGNFNTTFTKLSEEDRLGHALLHMRGELKKFHEREIKQARDRAAALIEGQENERRRIINDLHDGVGQLLTAVRMRVEMLEGNDHLKQEIKAQINETIAEVKRISYNVMPQALVDFGLEAALKGLCDTVKKYAPVKIDFRYVNECNHLLNFEITIAVFRIAQEGLNNIVKHAGANLVTFHVLDKEDELYVVLEDNGKGFNESKIKTGSGLKNIRERAKLLNGFVEINSTEGHGTVIEVHIPIPEKLTTSS
jgi:two-component system, NarL family, sensor kinase